MVSIEFKFNSLLQEKISFELYSYLSSKYTKKNGRKASVQLLLNSIYSLSKVK